MEHQWFRHGLPEGVYSLNDECLRLKVPAHCNSLWHLLNCAAVLALPF